MNAVEPVWYMAECPCGCHEQVRWTARMWGASGTGHNHSVVDVGPCSTSVPAETEVAL